MSRPSQNRRYRPMKRLFDIGLTVAGMPLWLPIAAGVAVCVRIGLGSPILFRQNRTGLNEKVFELVKFRTMVLASETVSSDEDDRRLNRLGRWLRDTSLDELPTFFNVLGGSMSLVGPRPLPVRYLPRFNPTQRRRHDVKPGVTGWAQLNGRNAISWDGRLSLDIWYVDHASIGLDMKIVFRSFVAVLTKKGVRPEGRATMPEFFGDEDDRT